MSTSIIRIAGLALALGLAAGVAAAQTTTPAEPAKKSSTEPSTADKVKNWTQKQWNAAKKEWQHDKTKWNSCNSQANAQHLSGKASWSFIYDCMKA